jgi:hypothetical protein
LAHTAPTEPVPSEPEPTVAIPVPPPAQPPVQPPTAPTVAEKAKPEKWAGRAVIAGAAAPGQKKAAAPTAPTAMMARYPDAATQMAPRMAQAPFPVRRRRGVFRRFFGALFALVLLLAVPVVSAYVAYKLSSGENPFEWPPSMDLSRIF